MFSKLTWADREFAGLVAIFEDCNCMKISTMHTSANIKSFGQVDLGYSIFVVLYFQYVWEKVLNTMALNTDKHAGCYCCERVTSAKMDIDSALNELGMLSSVTESRKQYLQVQSHYYIYNILYYFLGMSRYTGIL